MSRKPSPPLVMTLLVLFITALSAPAHAQKGGGKGGGGNDKGDSGDGTVFPVQYQIETIQVPGITRIIDANDYGEVLCYTDRTGNYAVVNPLGEIKYPGQLLNTTVNWIVDNFTGINNRGQLAASVRQEGVSGRSAAVLTPDGQGRYNLEVFEGFSYAWAINDQGAIVVDYLLNDENRLAVLTPQDVITLPIGAVGNSPVVLNNCNEVLISIVGVGKVKVAPHGDVTILELHPDSSGGRTESDLNDAGLMVGIQSFLQGKGKNQGEIWRPVLYDANGAVSLVELPTSESVTYAFIRTNDQLINGTSPVAGVSFRNRDALEDVWLKVPGYPSTYLVNLMSAEDQLLWAAIDFLPSSFSGDEVELLTPRNDDGSVNDAAFPSMIGIDRTGGGIFILSATAKP